MGAVPVIGDDNIFIETGIDKNHGRLVCLDADTGKKKWDVPNLGGGILYMYREGVVFTLVDETARGGMAWKGKKATLHAFKAEDGAFLWKYSFGPRSKSGSFFTVYDDGVLWVPDVKDARNQWGPGMVKGLGIKTGKVVKQYDTPR